MVCIFNEKWRVKIYILFVVLTNRETTKSCISSFNFIFYFKKKPYQNLITILSIDISYFSKKIVRVCLLSIVLLENTYADMQQKHNHKPVKLVLVILH